LAANNGSEMVVRNPCFMESGDLQPTTPKSTGTTNNTVLLANKTPISQYSDLFHHQEIAGLN
jgi:hypothetical protein